MQLKINPLSNKIIIIILFLHIAIWMLFMPIAQLQLFLFGRRVFTLLHMGIFEALLIIAFLIINSFHININTITKNTLMMAAALFILLIISCATNPDVSIYWRCYYFVYWIMPFIVILITVQKHININGLLNFLLVIVTVHALIIIYQHYSNDILWPFTVDDQGEKIFFISSGYYNNGPFMDRCPGVCISGLEAGVILIFGTIITIIKPDLKKRWKTILICLFLTAMWFTGTRNIYVQFIFIGVLFFILKLSIKRKHKIILCLLATISSMVLYVLLFNNIGSGTATKTIMTDTLSVGIRLQNWLSVIDKISEEGVLKIVLGQGVWQSAGFGILIDNMYLELIVLVGVIGSFLFLQYLIIISKEILKLNNNTGYLLAAFILSSFVYGIANVVGNSFFTMIILSIVIYNNELKIGRS